MKLSDLPLLATVVAGAFLALATSKADAIGYTYTSVDVPSALVTEPIDINGAGQIAGIFEDSLGRYYGFVDINGIFTTNDQTTDYIDDRANDAGELVGYVVSADIAQGFLDSGGIYTTIDFPGATNTIPVGINDAGEIVGYFTIGGEGNPSGYIYGFLATPVSNVPEPSALATFVAGLVGIGMIRARMRTGCRMH